MYGKKASGLVVNPLDREPATLECSEANEPWQPSPKWIRFLINYGCGCSALPPTVRRIILLSLPWDSAAAGLVAVGAVRHRLSLTGADDCASHFQRLERLAAKPSGTTYLRHEEYKGRFRIVAGGGGIVWVEREDSFWQKRLKRTAIFPWNATRWQIEGEPAVLPLHGDNQRYRPFYELLVEHAPTILPQNLARSDSAICLAGRVTGEAASRAILAAIRFRTGNRDVDLSQLATVHGWSDGTVSRMTFFNTRTGQFDRRPMPPALVIADGDLAFHRVLNSKQFECSNIVGVIHRAIERDRLEALGNKIAELRQWYTPDVDCLQGVQPEQAAIVMTVFKRGAA